MKSQLEFLYLLDAIISSLGILGTILMIYFYKFISDRQAYSSRLVIYLSITSSVLASMNILNYYQQINDIQTSTLCTVQGYVREVGLLGCLQFACIISWNLYIRTKQGDFEFERFEKYIIIGVIASSTGLSAM